MVCGRIQPQFHLWLCSAAIRGCGQDKLRSFTCYFLRRCCRDSARGRKASDFLGLALHKDQSLRVTLWSQKLDVGGNASPKLATPKGLAKWIKRGHQGNHLESEKEDSMTHWSIGSKSSNSWKYLSQKNDLVFQSHSSPRSCVAAARHSQRRHIKPRSTWPGIAPVML